MIATAIFLVVLALVVLHIASKPIYKANKDDRK